MNTNEQSHIKETIERSAAACAEILNEHRERQKAAGDIAKTLDAQRAAIESVIENEDTTPAGSRHPGETN